MTPSPDAAEKTDTDEATVTAHVCNPDRTVFTEEDNSEGWIATDVTVDVRR